MHKKGKEDSLAEESILMDCRKKAEQEKCARLIEGDGNLSLISDAMHIFINKSKGIVSWKIHGKEMLEGPVRLELFRPLTDNDMGAGYDQTYGIWMEAARFAQLKSVQACQNQVRFLYELPYVGRQVEMELVLAGKTADIRLRLVPIKNGLLPPCFGLRLPLKGKNLPFDWIGRGQADTYADRKQLPYGLYASAAKKEFVPYLRPQECGNHEDTYRLIVPEMTIEASNSPFSFSILPWTSEQIELANHEWELPESEQDVRRILSFMMGVGGDDSWGAPVHDAWLPSKDLPELHFSISANA
jgi:beta-galactosidase